MSSKKSISLAEHVAKAAEKEAKKNYAGNLSSYINALICKDIPQKVEEEYLKRPVQCAGVFPANYSGICGYCGRELKGELSCRAIYSNGKEDWAHLSCCRKE